MIVNMGIMAWLRRTLRKQVRPIPPPPPWQRDLLGEEALRHVEERRRIISTMVRSTQDEVDAINRERRRRD